MATEFTHSIRKFELERTIGLLPPNCKLLEIGAGDGWQANQLKSYCASIDAIDISDDGEKDFFHFPVAHYNGNDIPFRNASFDVIYSSNVLEHIVDFYELNNEIDRVLKPGGLAIHCVPSATWRIWTSIGHPIYVIKWAYRFAQIRIKTGASLKPRNKNTDKLKWWALALLILFSPRHGEHGNTISETWLFSRKQWTQKFKRHGWQIVSYKSSGIFYTGNEVFGLKFNNPWRSILSRILGSSSHIFVLKKE